MSYSFVFGPAGSGKTEHAFRTVIRESLEQKERHFFLLVPEQYGMMMQKRMLELHPKHASANIEVLSFNRLAWRIFEECGVRSPGIMDDTGKAMVLRRVAAAEADRLTVWRHRLRQAGFTAHVKSMISEFYQYGVTPEMLDRAAEDSSGTVRLPLRQKLRDLSVLYGAFREFVTSDRIPAEELLPMLCRYLPQSRLVRDAVFLLDGFTGFTPVQYRVIGTLLPLASELRFTVTIGADADPYRIPAAEDLFRMSAEMTQKIARLAADLSIPRGEDLFLREKYRFAKAPALSFLEEHFLRYDGAVCPGTPEGITVCTAETPAEEAAAAAAEILRLVKSEGYRYREIAVISADFENYEPELRHEFLRQGIPFYSDRSLSVAANPLPEMLRAALECVADRYSARSFLRFLKCGLIPDPDRMIPVCESYMERCGIRSYGKLSAAWEYLPADLDWIDLEALNTFRQRAVLLLEPLRTVFHDGKATVGAVSACLRGLMEETGAESTLEQWKTRFAEAGDAEHVREYERVYPETVRILTEMETLLGDEELGRDDMRGILEAGLAEVKVGQIPAFADRVAVGDITRTRLSEIRALLFLGMNDGLIPKLKQEGCILTDREKEALASLKISLAPTAKEDLWIQRFYLYRVLTQPEERLYLSCAEKDRDGKALRPSGILTRLKNLFPDLRERYWNGETELWSELQARRLLTSKLTEIRAALPDGEEAAAGLLDSTAALLTGYCADPGRKETAERLIDAAAWFYDGGGLTPETAELLYGDLLSGSVTRLETFSRCACRHFLQYGLSLQEKRIFEISSADLGTLAHRAVQLAFLHAEREGLDIRKLDEEGLADLAGRSTEEAALQDAAGLYTDTARNQWLLKRVRKIVTRSISYFAEQLRRGDYRPYAYEQRFDGAKGNQRLSIPLEHGTLALRGTTDRVDICEDGGKIYVKIIDYKTGNTTWEPFRILSGSQIQLILYLDAMTELLEQRYPGKEIVPGAVFYEPLADPVLRQDPGDNPDRLESKLMKELRPSGLVNVEPDALKHLSPVGPEMTEILPLSYKGGSPAGDGAAFRKQFDDLRTFVRKEAEKSGSRILSGETEAVPLTEEKSQACTYCPYRAVCGYDRRSGGFRIRKNGKKDAGEVWLRIRESAPEQEQKNAPEQEQVNEGGSHAELD